MGKRVVTAIILMVIASAILVYSHNRVGSVFFLLCLDAIAFIGLWEFYTIVEKKGGTSLMAFGIVAGVIYCTMSFLASENPLVKVAPVFLDATMVAIILTFFVFQFLRRDNSSVIHNLGATIAGMIYLAWLLAFAAKINYFPGLNGEGMWYIVLLLGIVKGGDSMAYLIGHTFGRTKICPHVSPKKTLEGSLAHVAAAVAVAMVARLTVLEHMTYLQTCIVAAVLSIVAQFGDLAESLLKRDAGVKDSGGQFPGIGGVLDIIDSLLFTLPVLYYLMRFWLIGVR